MSFLLEGSLGEGWDSLEMSPVEGHPHSEPMSSLPHCHENRSMVLLTRGSEVARLLASSLPVPREITGQVSHYTRTAL